MISTKMACLMRKKNRLPKMLVKSVPRRDAPSGMLTRMEKSLKKNAKRRVTHCVQRSRKKLARFAEVDTDGDGSLSADEFGAIGSIERLLRSPKSIARIFARLDDDENEGISADEFTLHLRHCRHHKGKGWGWGNAQRVTRMIR